MPFRLVVQSWRPMPVATMWKRFVTGSKAAAGEWRLRPPEISLSVPQPDVVYTRCTSATPGPALAE